MTGPQQIRGAEVRARVLAFIARCGPVSATQVAAAMGMKAGTIMKVCRALRRAGRLRQIGTGDYGERLLEVNGVTVAAPPERAN